MCLIFTNFKNGRHFELATNFFLSEVIPEVEYTKNSRYYLSAARAYFTKDVRTSLAKPPVKFNGDLGMIV